MGMAVGAEEGEDEETSLGSNFVAKAERDEETEGRETEGKAAEGEGG